MTNSKRNNHASSKKFGLMQQGQQKIKLDIKKPRSILPPLELPYPPKIELDSVVAKLVSKPKLARFPNAFIMYRNEYVQYLKAKNIHLSMTELSPMVAASWKREPEFVKDTYTQFAGEAEKLYIRAAACQQQQRIYKFQTTMFSPATFDDESSQSSSPPDFNQDIIHHHQEIIIGDPNPIITTTTTNNNDNLLLSNIESDYSYPNNTRGRLGVTEEENIWNLSVDYNNKILIGTTSAEQQNIIIERITKYQDSGILN
ncbi:14235_t:CDS:2 [Entrophospora sp. SA101]|nr:14235_t:CDS:2 [Entrophospora sp. SA101]